jgi:hypothetical protein
MLSVTPPSPPPPPRALTPRDDDGDSDGDSDDDSDDDRVGDRGNVGSAFRGSSAGDGAGGDDSKQPTADSDAVARLNRLLGLTADWADVQADEGDNNDANNDADDDDDDDDDR